MKKEISIQKLGSSVIDQISAGEVVERPAGLVKELIENSLDAGADSIEIQFSDGGLFVSVKDNGSGIPSDELSLALARHATSKIRKMGDLFSIESCGFRGEALASIASVSCLNLISRTKNSKTAYRLKSEFGKTLNIEKVSGSLGTTVTVDLLFQNVPARLRFLKSEAVEALAIKNIIIAQALARHDVQFRVITKGRMIFYWPQCGSRLKRAEMILGEKPLYQHKGGERGFCEVEVVLSAPNKTARSSKKMWFFVNGRVVEDKILYGALMSAHRNLLMHGEYPISALFLQMNPAEVDVNIHPTKTKIRFRNQARVFQTVQKAVRSLLEKGPWLTHLSPSAKELLSETKPRRNDHLQQANFSLNPPSKYPPQTAPIERKVIEETFHQKTPPTNAKQNTAPIVEKALVKDKTLAKTFSSLQVLAQAHKTYIITQSPASIVFIDQHAAHERILFEKLLQGMKQKAPPSQKNLIALSIKMDPAEVAAVFSMKESFLSLGIEIKNQKPDEIKVLSSPSFIKPAVVEKAIRDLAFKNIETGEPWTIEKVVSHIAATMACHSAIRAGQILSIKEMESLLEQMEEFCFSSFCPHGRPVFVEYPLLKLEKDFGRVL